MQRFKNLQITNDEKDFNFEKNQAALATILLNDQTKWLQSNATDILDELSLQIDQSHDFFCFLCWNRRISKISLQRFYETLNILETTQDPKSTAQRMCFAGRTRQLLV